jgi:hypothetical protein
MEDFYIPFIILGIISVLFILLIAFSIWILNNKKGTKIYKWVNKHIITETDLDI